MGAKNSLFMNRVSCLAKWLIQSITAFIISKSCIHSIFRDSGKNRYSMLVVLSQLKFTQHTGLWLMITFTIYLSNKLTISLTPLIHVISLLITTFLFKACDLTSQFTQVMQSTKFKTNHKHHKFKPKQTTVHKKRHKNVKGKIKQIEVIFAHLIKGCRPL